MAVAISFCLPYWVNDISCYLYKNKIEDEVFANSKVKVLQVINGCGNSSGGGNHTDLYVGILIETVLSKDELLYEFSDVRYVYNIEKRGEKTLAIKNMNLRFDEQKYSDNQDYYILEFIKESPCSEFDMRGH